MTHHKFWLLFICIVASCSCATIFGLFVIILRHRGPSLGTSTAGAQLVSCTQSIAHVDALEDTFRPMLLSLEWWQNIIAGTTPSETADDTAVAPAASSTARSVRQDKADEDARCSFVISLTVIPHPGGTHVPSPTPASTATPLSPLFGATPAAQAAPPSGSSSAALPIVMWVWLDADARGASRDTRWWFSATAFLGRFSWETILFSLREDPLRCNDVLVEFAASSWDVVHDPFWAVMQARFATCVIYTANRSDELDAQALLLRLATSVSLSVESSTLWTWMFGWMRTLPSDRAAFTQAWAGVTARQLSRPAETLAASFINDIWHMAAAQRPDLTADCQSGPHVGGLSMLPVFVGRYPARRFRIGCNPQHVDTLDLNDEADEESARAHLRPIGFFAMAVYIHQLMHKSLPRTRVLLMVTILLDAPAWISLRLVMSLVPIVIGYLCNTSTSDEFFALATREDSATRAVYPPPPPDMLLVAVAALSMAPTPMATAAITLCVGLDAFRGERARRAMYEYMTRRTAYRNRRDITWEVLLGPVRTLVLLYDAAVLPILMIWWIVAPAIYSLMNESPYATVTSFAIYFVAIPAYAAFSRAAVHS